VDRLGEILLLLGIERRVPGHDLGARVLLKHLGDQRPGELALVLRRHRRDPTGGVLPPLLREPVTDVAAQALD